MLKHFLTFRAIMIMARAEITAFNGMIAVFHCKLI